MGRLHAGTLGQHSTDLANNIRFIHETPSREQIMLLRSLFLTSDNPARVAQFYREVAGLALEEVGSGSGYLYWKIDDGQMQLAIHGAKEFADYTFPPNKGSNLTHLYFQIEDQAAFLGHLNNCGLEPYAVDDVVVTVEDPDGRKVMFGTA
jgi:hypothetical protein